MADFERIGPLIVLVRDGADPRRSQGRVRARRGGGARVDYRLGDAERRTLAEGIHAAVHLHFAAGAESVLTLHANARDLKPTDDIDWILRATGPEHRIGLFSAHVNGTCRMGTDPRTSGCSPTGQRHGAPGIFIADGSIFPSAPSANPQATIMAAASLIADLL
jgi:choline dehydrogenase-like flavoprotein